MTLPAPQVLRQLHGQPARCPGRAVDQNRFPSRKVSALHHRRPGGHTRIRNSGRGDVIEGVRQFHQPP